MCGSPGVARTPEGHPTERHRKLLHRVVLRRQQRPLPVSGGMFVCVHTPRQTAHGDFVGGFVGGRLSIRVRAEAPKSWLSTQDSPAN
jgi:hypothetical protein